MRLGRINHIRCGEPEENSTYVVISDEMTDEEFREAAKRAINTYINVLDTPMSGRPSSPQRMVDVLAVPPEITIAELREKHAAQEEAFNNWGDEVRQRRKTLAHYLKEEKLIVVQWASDIPVAKANWGHRHGVSIDYDGVPHYEIHDDL